jgi:hypothetical protein
VNGAVIVAVPVVRMVQVPGDDEVDVIAVRHRLVAAARGVMVSGGVSGAGMPRRAGVGVGAANCKLVLVDVIAVHVVQVAIVQVVGVAVVLDSLVPASLAVGVRVPGVFVAAHARLLWGRWTVDDLIARP